MKFATKLSLGCITLLSCALCAAGLILTGKSFSGSLETTRAAMQAQQAKEKYTLERCIFTAAETNTLFSTNPMVENYTLATAAQQYAEQTADANSGLALWVNGAYTLYSNLPTALPRAVQMQAVSNGADHWQLTARGTGICCCPSHWIFPACRQTCSAPTMSPACLPRATPSCGPGWRLQPLCWRWAARRQFSSAASSPGR